MTSGPPPAPPFSFTFHDSVSALNVPLKTYLTSHEEFDAIATGALVFNSENRLLIIQRASHDSMPNRWEIPGGGCDLDDESILHGMAREVWEESGLVVSSVGRKIGSAEGHVFFSRRGLRICKFTFEAEVESSEPVRLDPNEHQNHLWVTEEECQNRKAERDGTVIEIKFTTPAQEADILEGFRIRNAAKSS